MSQTKISWAEITLNPITGCTKISDGCKYCYAEIMSRRLKGMKKQKKYKNGFDLTTHEEVLNEVSKLKKSSLIFLNSMSDSFHKDVPLAFIKKVFKVMNDHPQHIFQVLTKRPEILLKYHEKLNWTSNIWMGVTVESNKYVSRIDMLRQTNAKLKFLSLEPLLTALPDLNLEGIDWVIVGGECASRPRPIQEAWVLDILSQCRRCNIPFFFKQWSGRRKKERGNLLQGKVYHEMPEL
jgi:protein gp37